MTAEESSGFPVGSLQMLEACDDHPLNIKEKLLDDKRCQNRFLVSIYNTVGRQWLETEDKSEGFCC